MDGYARHRSIAFILRAIPTSGISTVWLELCTISNGPLAGRHGGNPMTAVCAFETFEHVSNRRESVIPIAPVEVKKLAGAASHAKVDLTVKSSVGVLDQ
jgi:hypothetical protein